MTFSPRSRLFANSIKATFGAAFLVLALGACTDNKVGRVCDLDVGDAGTTSTGTSATLNSSAVECPTRICVLPVAEKTTNTTSLCTQTCSSDDDCSDGETTSNQMSTQCKTGFTCIIPTTVGELCCVHMCVCKDFVDPTRSHATPVVCLSGQSMCHNVH